MAVDDGLTKVRMFPDGLHGVQNVLTMGFFERYIQRFISYLADRAVAQASTDLEYTDVHGVCDMPHSESLLTMLSAGAAINPPDRSADLFDGVKQASRLDPDHSTEMGRPRYLLLNSGIRINVDSTRSLRFGPNYSTQTTGHLGRCKVLLN
jgi:hypothetical protein